MRRRTAKLVLTLAVGILLAPSASNAQQAGKVARIGYLVLGSGLGPRDEAFLAGLRDLGYTEGRNVITEYRYAHGRVDQLNDLAAELVGHNVDVIVALSTILARPAKSATRAIPIVAVSGDPVGTGLVASLARPGGNVTGLTFFSPELASKRLELLKDALGVVTRVGVLWNADGPAKVLEFEAVQASAPRLGLQIRSLEVRAPDPQFDGAFLQATRWRAESLLVLGNPLTLEHRARITAFATKHRLPSMYDSRQFVEAGGLIAYGPRFTDLYRRAAAYVDRILKGATPADLPVEQPTRFELVINLKTAKALGLTLPPSLLVRADEVLQ